METLGNGSMRLTRLALGILAIAVCLGSNKLCAQTQAIDVNRSSLKIRVFKSGAFSAFAHDHEIQAPIEEGKSDSPASQRFRCGVTCAKIVWSASRSRSRSVPKSNTPWKEMR